jgi:hypothetical protein
MPRAKFDKNCGQKQEREKWIYNLIFPVRNPQSKEKRVVQCDFIIQGIN